MNPTIADQPAVSTALSGGWLAHTWRLTRWNLFLAGRRLMSKILAVILVVGFVFVIGILLLSFLTLRSVSDAGPQPCPPTPVGAQATAGSGPGETLPPTCQNPSPDEQQQAQQSAAEAQQQFANLLTFPTNLSVVGGYTTVMGVILLCILAGALIGNEYSFGTQRLALSRGVSRAQLVVSQVWALAILALIVALGMLLLGAIAGLLLGPAVGGVIPAISFAGWGEILLYWLALALALLAYSLIALLLGTLGRSTAVGIAGSLGYVIVEFIALPILAVVSIGVDGNVGSTLAVVHNLFLGPNLTAALVGVSQSPLDLGGRGADNQGVALIPPLEGLLVSLAYCAVLISLSYWLLRKRDVTN